MASKFLAIGCNADQFQCNDGSCIESFQRCDGVRDCSSAEDELSCRCQPPNFQCISGNCIDSERVCDGADDCDDGSDEFSCPARECSPGYFRCDDGACIPMANRCDGTYHCSDATDEDDCVITERMVNVNEDEPGETLLLDLDIGHMSSGCRDDEFRCGEGTCIPLSQRCDQVYHCYDGTDEIGCPSM
ncbi:Low-density lipoprotein (LDL) receptor class A repeat [Trinorchestia longiramus]|nr:Low-density lipoprotein (LDL) receptor class A repeat [Trinorchestia longiramus]